MLLMCRPSDINLTYVHTVECFCFVFVKQVYYYCCYYYYYYWSVPVILDSEFSYYRYYQIVCYFLMHVVF